MRDRLWRPALTAVAVITMAALLHIRAAAAQPVCHEVPSFVNVEVPTIVPLHPRVGDLVELQFTISAAVYSLIGATLRGTETLFEGETATFHDRTPLFELRAVQAGAATIQLEVTYGTELACTDDGGHTYYVYGPNHTTTSRTYDVQVSVACAGDCDGDGSTSVDEIVGGIAIALGDVLLDECPVFDSSLDGAVTVDEVIGAVDTALGGCVQPTPIPAPSVDVSFDFRNGAEGWSASFADYKFGQHPLLELMSSVAPLPPELGLAGTGYLLSGNNHSDDLFMFLTRPSSGDDGIVANRAYTLSYTIRFASNAPTGCAGIGGAPGESVYLKAGGAPIEPQLTYGADGEVRTNVDKGNQSEGGPAASVAGNIANGRPCDDVAPYVALESSHIHPFPVSSNLAGELWLLVGTDSGFEGTTAIYYQSIDVTLTPE